MLRYVGDGTLIPGVPPRDLSEAEARQFGALIVEVDAAREAAGMGALYERTTDDGPRTKVKSKAQVEVATEADLTPEEG